MLRSSSALTAPSGSWTAVPRTAIGRIDPTTQAITEFSSGLNPGIALGRLAAGPDGNIWFGDKGTTHAIGKIDPTTHAITEFSVGLNAGSLPGGMGTGSDGNVWFTDQGAIKAIGRIGVGAPAASITARRSAGRASQASQQVVQRRSLVDLGRTSSPRTSRSRFDGYQWLLDGSAIAGATDPLVPAHRRRRRAISSRAR